MREPLVLSNSTIAPVVIKPFVGSTTHDLELYTLYLLDIVYCMNEDRVTIKVIVDEFNKDYKD